MRVIILFLIFWNFNIQGDNSCDIEIKYRIEHSSNGENAKVFITIEKGDDPFELNLFDENAPQKGFIETVNFQDYQLNEEILVFRNLKPSSYIIRIDNENCKSSISGFNGITIN